MKRITDEMRRMHRKMNHWFRNFDENPWNFDEEDFSSYRKARVEAQETDEEFLVAIELPGVNKKDIELEAENNVLVIKAESKQEKENKEENSYSYTESYSGFYRTIPLPENADTEKIDAEYTKGVLKLRIPKKESKKKGKTIQIR
ncbi:MAG: Hsp20/alpha crystallin family protein [Nanoarchaeota archaeon]|nr:Hsp20/alpha crystallin family protein [Nanoarchaeota archaeon]MBU1051997.1 Hsp20/alpha crystallin family protein [Nanoarchaeota archaeon]MBU1988245.1 Hsp20/alpha crystallin family protein [Nanoarchaeota archaeon]